MPNFERLSRMGHEQVVYCFDPEVGLKAIIAIHNTTLGPALGGCRMWDYATEEEALTDVLRLSRGMTYKAAVAGLNLGGGKTVVMGDPKKDKSEGLFRSLGRFVDSLNGRYITAEDVGTDVNDMEWVFMETDNAVGVALVHGGSGDPSPFTAAGVFRGIEACKDRRLPNAEMRDLSVAVQGCGHVGSHLIERLVQTGTRVVITDIDRARCQALADRFKGVEIVGPQEIYDVPCDIFAPCALGAVINPDTCERLKCTIVAGAANNQLEHIRMGDALKARGILYAPDYAINAGGLMNVSIELEGYNRQLAERMVERIYGNLQRIFDISDRENVSTAKAAELVAERRITTLGKLKSRYVAPTARARYRGRTQPTNGR